MGDIVIPAGVVNEYAWLAGVEAQGARQESPMLSVRDVPLQMAEGPE